MPTVTIHESFISNDHIVSDDTYYSLVNDLELLGQGIHRTVYALSDDYVLKVARGQYAGSNANRAEVASWKYVVDTPYGEHFNPVVAASPSGAWLVAPRVQMVAADYTHDMDEIPSLDDWRSETLRRLERDLHLMDTHHGNLGFDGHKWVVIDYGFGVRGAETDDEDNEPEPDETCHCSECELEQHKYRSCPAHTEHPRSCFFCLGSRCTCDDTECVVSRNTQHCVADGCINALIGRQTVPNSAGERVLVCSSHRFDLGPLPDNHAWPRLFAPNHPFLLLPDITHTDGRHFVIASAHLL